MHSPHVKSKYCFYYDNLLCEFFHRENFKFCIPVAHRPSLSISISKYTYILTLEVFFLLKQKMWRNCSMPESNWLKISEDNCHNLWDRLPLLAVKNHLLSEFLVKKNLSSDIRNNKKETVISEAMILMQVSIRWKIRWSGWWKKCHTFSILTNFFCWNWLNKSWCKLLAA